MTEKNERRSCCKVVETRSDDNVVTIKVQAADAKQAEACKQAVENCGESISQCLPDDCCK